MQFRTLSACLSIVLLLTSVNAHAQAPAGQTPPPGKLGSEQSDRTLGKAIADSWITMKVHAQFVTEDALEGSNIDVDTRSGVVTLSGTVATETGRTRAVQIARTTDGVTSVDDKALRVAAATVGTAGQAADAGKRVGRTVNDGWIKSKIYSQYLFEDALNDSDIDLKVTNGMVTLSGTARTEAGRAQAEAIAKGTDGVKSVTNTVKVAPR
jgi:hyperosmotically inducible periplasmic protein